VATFVSLLLCGHCGLRITQTESPSPSKDLSVSLAPWLPLAIALRDLLKCERRSVEHSEEHQLTPEQSTSAIVVHHPEAKYFAAR
jgi:hypothetical protein